MTLRFPVRRNPSPASPQRRAEVMANPGFGKYFTDHMARAVWKQDGGWQDSEIIPFGPISMHPAAAVLHYAQEIFEGMKAYRHADGSIWSFRPEANGERFARSARRLALPELPVPDFIASVEALVSADQAWVPDDGEHSLYLRPFMFASEAFLGVRPAQEITYMVIACPVGAYFSGGVRPVSIWLSSQYTRAARGGTGEAKCGGNYAASLAPMIEAAAHGCEQVCFLDAAQGRYVEELGGMNLYFVTADGRIITPEARHDPQGRHPRVDPHHRQGTGARGGGAPSGDHRMAAGRGQRRDHRGLRVRHQRRGHPGRPVGLGRRRGDGREGWRRRLGDHADSPPTGRHPVRAGNRPVRLDDPPSLSRRGSTRRMGSGDRVFGCGSLAAW